jgi:hypothetical protein
MSEAMVGAYGAFQPVDSKTKDIFERALKGHLGVGYTPLIVSTQVVAGTNYLYMCNGQVVSPGAQPFPAEVIIFDPLEGPPHITSIKRIP